MTLWKFAYLVTKKFINWNPDRNQMRKKIMKRFVIDYVVAATFRNLTMYEYMRQCTCRMCNVYIETFRLYRQYMYI